MRSIRHLPMLSALLLGTLAHAAKVNIIEMAVNDDDSSTLGALSVNQFIEIGSNYTTVTAPSAWSSYRFTHWTMSGESAPNSLRDAWGRAQNPISWQISVAATATAHYLPSTRDSDADGLPDWYEIEHFGELSRVATDDSDGDAIALLTEYNSGTSPLYPNDGREGNVACASSGLVTCNLAGYPTYTLRSMPAGSVNQSATVPPGTVVTLPDLSGNANFAYWMIDGVRQDDPWGRSITTMSFTMASANRDAVAYLITGDSDGDAVPDAYEQRYYGSLTNNGSSDTDGDGITLLAEFSGNTSPIQANVTQDGGVTWTDSAMVTCNLAGYPTYTLRSVPAGTVNQSATVPPGTVVTLPDLSDNVNFAYWTLDGLRLQDPWGRALTTQSLTMASADREAVAYLITGDSDGDGVPDAYEQRFYGNLTNNGTSDTDGDGIGMLAEYTGNSSPIQSNHSQAGGVAWADGALITVDLQADIAVEPLAGQDLSDGGSHAWGTAEVGIPTTLTYKVRNTGGTPLSGLDITLTGEDASLFSVSQLPPSPLAHHASTTFGIQLMASTPGTKSVQIHIASNDANENPFDLTVSVDTVLSLRVDSDNDGINDAAEFQMAAMGFNWQVSQATLAATYLSNAHLNGLFTNNQVQALRVPSPTLTHDPQSGQFILKVSLEKSPDRRNYQPFPITQPAATINAQGELELQFHPIDNAAFFRLETK